MTQPSFAPEAHTLDALDLTEAVFNQVQRRKHTPLVTQQKVCDGQTEGLYLQLAMIGPDKTGSCAVIGTSYSHQLYATPPPG
jgi:hypothetical protein